MSAVAREIDRLPPQPPEPTSDSRARAALMLAPTLVRADIPEPIRRGFEDPAPTSIRANVPRVGPRFSDRQLAVFFAAVALLVMLSHELRYSTGQAVWWAQVARPLHVDLAPGANPVPFTPDAGPFDQRLGYAVLPQRIARLTKMDFEIANQARPSAQMYALNQRGLDAIYQEKAQAGLTLLDRTGRTLYNARYPHFLYDKFESIPPLVVSSLLFVEDREFLDGRWNRNPVMDWERLSKAAGLRLLGYVGVDDAVIGGSTLATQLEKFRHSPGGRTETVGEKLRQMASASVRIYRNGVDNEQARKEVVTDYINSLPLAGRADQGEVIGLGDGLQAWYGEDFDAINRDLVAAETDPERGAFAFKHALSLIIAARRPTYYLGQNPSDLAALTDSYIRVMGNAGVISPALRQAALEQSLSELSVHAERQVPAEPIRRTKRHQPGARPVGESARRERHVRAGSDRSGCAHDDRRADSKLGERDARESERPGHAEKIRFDRRAPARLRGSRQGDL